MSDEIMCPNCVRPWKCGLDGDAREQEYANGKSHGLLEGWVFGIGEGYIAGLDAAEAAIRAFKEQP